MILFVIIIAAIILDFMVFWNVGKDGRLVRGLSRLRIRKAAGLFDINFIDSKQLFVQLNKELPNVMFINDIDVDKAIMLMESRLDNVRAVYRHEQFDFTEQQVAFNMVVIVTRDGCIIEISSIYNYVELLYTIDQTPWANCLAKDLSAFRLNTADSAIARNVCVTGFAGQVN